MKITVKKKQLYISVLLLALISCAAFYSIWLIRLEAGNPDPFAYTYYSYPASQNIQLHIIQASADHIALTAVDSSVSEQEAYGINGGFFYEQSLLSIAVTNDEPVGGTRGEYGSGWENVKFSRGTLVWDPVLNSFSIQAASAASELIVEDRTRYFAQGGISMSLSHDAGWYAQAVREGMPGIDNLHMRSAILYDRNNQVWLVVTQNRCTAEDFRNAIKEAGKDLVVDGIFLDGDGSSQLQVKEALLTGDNRRIRQMITLVP